MNFSRRDDEPLARHLAIRLGGPCDTFLVAHHEEGLADAWAWCRQRELRPTMLGAGTRTIGRAGGVRGAVLRLGQGFARHDVRDTIHWVGASRPVPAMVARAMALGQSGLERFACTAGSLGAALIHDVGWENVVDKVQIWRRGRIVDADLEDVQGKKTAVVVGAMLTLEPSTVGRVTEVTLRTLSRAEPIPPGSWFGTPQSDELRELIRSARLPMVRLRRAAIPRKSPELLVNLGGASVGDVQLLLKSMVDRVKTVRGEVLAPRMRWLGVHGNR
ncbi:MAG: FAD-binding protein [Myxococcota bacterium]